jgi:pimeloyl-ACP methyl ester carboxylesterase
MKKNSRQKDERTRARGCLRLIGVVLLAVVGLIVGLVGAWSVSTNQNIAKNEPYLDRTVGAPGQFAKTADGYMLHYQTRGDPKADQVGAPILMLHGFNQASNTEFSLIAPYMTEGRSVLMPDFLGFGYSQRVTQANPALTIAGQARNMAQLLDTLGVAKVDVIGVSYGGSVAAQFALDYPERVRKLVLIGPQIFDIGGGIFSTLGNLPFGLGRAFTWDALGSGARGTMLYSLGCQSNGYCPDASRVADRLRRAQISGTTDTFVAINITPQQTRVPIDIGQIAAPTLLLYGDRDAFYPRDIAEKVKAAIPNAQLQFVPDADHTPQMHRPERTAQILNAFLNS